ESANDGRPPGRRDRGRRDHLRRRFREAGPDEDPQERPPDRDPAAQASADALAERPDAQHGRPRRGRRALRHGLPPRGERLQGHLGRQETGGRPTERRGRETRRGCGQGHGRPPSARTRLSESSEVPHDRERGGLPRGARRRRQVPRAISLGAGQGDWPRAILAPRHPEECFSLTAKAFNLAEIYQTPIIVISDLYLGEGYRTVDKLDFNVPIVRGMMAADGGTAKDYKRYEI